jgi:PLP dependent protein
MTEDATPGGAKIVLMSLAENLERIRGRIEDACARAGRSPEEVTLVAVTKGVPLERIREAYDLGLRHFGESRLQEALPKIEAMPEDVVWHFVGKLQSNKAKKAAERFQVLHTIEGESQLREIRKADRLVDALIEVNLGEEAQKSGIPEKILDQFHLRLLHYDNVRFRGLMTIGPDLNDPEAMRPFFRRLRELDDRVGGDWLSMGMSGDFEVAIQEGSTHVRIGTALFGAKR